MSSKGNQHILVMTPYFSFWIDAVNLSDQKVREKVMILTELSGPPMDFCTTLKATHFVLD